jgi:beta-lactamase regulating signal transducer with metallopeptidase domain
MTWLIQAVLLNAMLATVLATAAWLIGRNGRRPALAHALWVLVLVKLVTPPLVRWPVELKVPRGGLFASVLEQPLSETAAVGPESVRPVPVVAPGPTSAVVAVEPVEQVESHSVSLAPTAQPWRFEAREPAAAAVQLGWSVWAWWLALAIWVTGALLLGVVCYRRLKRFSSVLRVASIADAGLQRRAGSLARNLGLSRAPTVVTLNGPISPLLWGFGRRATIVLPTSLWERLNADEQDAVLVHELAHFARRDHLVRVLELCVTVLYWWHPVVWMARRHIEATEEQCCDAWVVGQTDGPRTYAEALLTTIDFISEHRTVLPPAASGVSDISAIERRLQQIMCETVPRSLNSSTRGIVLGLVVLLPLQPLLLAAPSRIVRELTSPLGSWTPTAESQVQSRIATQSPGTQTGLNGSGLPPVEPDSSLLESVIFQTGPAADGGAAVAVSPNGRYRIVNEGSGRVAFEDPARKRRVDLTSFYITTAVFFPNSERFVTGSADGLLRIWSCDDAQSASSTLQRHGAEVVSIDISSDGRRLVSGDRNGRLLVFLRLDESDAFESIGLDSPVTSLRFSPDGRVIAAAVGDRFGRTDHYIELLDAESLTTLGRIETDAPIASLEFLASDRLLGVDGLGTVTVWHPGLRYVIDGGTLTRQDVTAAAFSPDTHAFDRVQPEYAVQLQELRPDALPASPLR